MGITTNRMHRSAWACVIVILAGCGDAGVTPSPPATPAASASVVASGPEVTLTVTGCTSPPSEDLSPGLATVTITNDSSSLANFELLRLSETFDVFDEFLVEARRRIDAGESPPGELPHIEEEVSRKLLEPGDTGALAGDLEAGIHAVICVVLDEHEDIVTVYATGPFVVKE